NVYRAMQALEAEHGKFVYLGAAKSPVTRMNGLIRYQVLMRIAPEVFGEVMPKIYAAADASRPKKGSIFVEINPQSLI
ncbi:MAG: hypothetical protein K2J16_05945, partial [Clostridia bacterium]|nr:hypothetical protein [Clostridia bacterium]